MVPFRLNAEATGGTGGLFEVSASAGPAYCEPGIVTEVEFDSFRPSLVQMAPAAVQSVVAGSVMVIAPLPLGSTVMVQVWLLPWTLRWALGDRAVVVLGERVVAQRLCS